MTSKDLLDVMQHLGAKYTDEADARAAKQRAWIVGRKPFLPVLTALGSAAVCIIILAGVMQIDRAGEQMQTLSQDISVQVVQETETTTVTTSSERCEDLRTTTTAKPKAIAQTDAKTETVRSTTAAAVQEDPAAVQVSDQDVAPEPTSETSAQTEPIVTQPSVETEPPVSEPPAIPENIYEAPTLVIDQVSGHAGETVAVAVYLFQNPGLRSGLWRIEFGLELKLNCITNENGDSVLNCLTCDHPYGINFTHRFAHYASNLKPETNWVVLNMTCSWIQGEEPPVLEGDGMFITYYFDIPEDAESGTVYDITWRSVGFSPDEGYNFDTVNGSITVL